ncbi:phenylalanine--tRNA ligase subunit beta [Bacillus marinisedimentorum]|uniref:phenylalanine--tRNA ligase subunit beta n=1 Tax=Bacillus marinisedimentorum TaxID=1821260 RepID=UPI000871EDD9|nr:phenylalanine--tRNA ligase subunit beta [Bacillus marinisedimentorum]
MLVSYNWLKEYVDIATITPEELADKITLSGIEVEGVEKLDKGLKNIIVGYVLQCEQHPNADKLNVCMVDIGEGEPVQIICGAPNVAKGQKVAVAKVGAVLPGNFKIKKAKLRGEASNGMICSLQELGIESKLVAKEFADGIYVFPEDTKVGTDAIKQLNLDDSVLELGLTPNRADAMNMFGVAYETAAILKKNIKFPEIELNAGGGHVADAVSVSVENADDNPYYGARVVRDVKIGPSPLWMQNRLVASGIRPSNNIVDITNYIMLEYGQPLHAFDLDRLGSKEIVVRRAKDGEKITTLDDMERTLTSAHLVITNGKNPVALAGVMGGADSEVQNDTVNVLIESAVFDGQRIRTASKDHGLRSEASSRYEKGLDPYRAKEAADRAAALMSEYAGGTVLEGIAEADNLTKEPAVLTIASEKINRVLGTEISVSETADIFKALRFEYKEENGDFTVTVPTRRPDITIEEDLIEEVGRLYGYEKIPTTLPVLEAKPGRLTEYQEKRRAVRRYLEGAGLMQSVTYSLTSEEKVQSYTVHEGFTPVKLAMPMSEERSMLRLSIVPHLLDVIQYNIARQIENAAFYETASVFLSKDGSASALPDEVEHLAGAVTGLWESHQWQGVKTPVDFFTVKGILEGMFSLLDVMEDISYQPSQLPGLHPGRTAEIMFKNEKVGYIGQVHPETQAEMDLNETYVFELNLERLLSLEAQELQYTPIPRYPSITRDIAIVADETLSAARAEEVIKEAGGKLLKETSLFDVYQGEHMEEGKKSLAFSLKYYDPERTLTDEEVTETHNGVLRALEEKLNTSLRS